MDLLKQAVQAYAGTRANGDGLVLTPIAGLRMMSLDAPRELHSTYRPLVCLVLQGAKHMTVGREEQVFSGGQSVIVSADMPVVGRIIRASRDEPYLAIAVELDMSILREVATHLGDIPPLRPSEIRTLFAVDTDGAAVDCAMRLMRLLDQPDAAALLRPGILRELHYWLLSGQHGQALRAMAAPDGYASRLAAAIAILRKDYRTRISVERLAAEAAMSHTAFHKHFKHMTSLSPGQYQKRLRLVEARRLMLDEGYSATSAAFDVGYESVSQFTREYGRMFKTPPKRDAMSARAASQGAARSWTATVAQDA
jgi:AraC-like DNA-binding protein